MGDKPQCSASASNSHIPQQDSGYSKQQAQSWRRDSTADRLLRPWLTRCKRNTTSPVIHTMNRQQHPNIWEPLAPLLCTRNKPDWIKRIRFGIKPSLHFLLDVMQKRQTFRRSFVGECALENLAQEEDHAAAPGKIVISLEYV